MTRARIYRGVRMWPFRSEHRERQSFAELVVAARLAVARLKRQAEHDARAVERIKPYLVDQGLSCQATADVLNLGDLNAKAILTR